MKAVLIIGGNIGNRAANLESARQFLGKYCGEIIQKSAIYETAAWGKTDQQAFLNQVLIIDTVLDPQKLMTTILEIEQEMGRIRQEKNGPRTIDIDILFYEDQIINSQNLQVPHPQIPNRAFVLEPLLELVPNFVHPILGKTIRNLRSECADPLPVNKL